MVFCFVLGYFIDNGAINMNEVLLDEDTHMSHILIFLKNKVIKLFRLNHIYIG